MIHNTVHFSVLNTFYLKDILTFRLTSLLQRKLDMAALFVSMQNRRVLHQKRLFGDRTNPLDHLNDVDIIER